MKVHYRLKQSEVECCELYSLQRRRRACRPQLKCPALGRSC
jgi:hypothetical protein